MFLFQLVTCFPTPISRSPDICFDIGHKNAANVNRRLLAHKKLTAREYRKQT